MTRVISLRSGEPYDVFVGRPGVFGNPFSHLSTEYNSVSLSRALSRFDAVRKHAAWIREPEQAELLSRVRKELYGKVLACACSQKDIARGMCHAVTLAKIADKRFA